MTALLFGVNIGSFLNVVIWRIPRGGSLVEPKYSYCPHCKRRLTAIDLFPLLSFLLLGRRCRTCKAPISWRYFTVELLTGLLFFGLALRFHQSAPDAVSLMLFAALLVPITYIDLDFFQIPTALNLLVFGVAIARDVWGIVQHEPNHAPLWGWLPRSIVGAIAGVLIFGTVRVAGWLWKRVEAMGLGDPLLARAMGAMLVQLVPNGPPLLRLFPVWVLLSCVSGLIVGIPLTIIRSRQEERAAKEAAELERQSALTKAGRRSGAAKRGDQRTVVEEKVDDANLEEEPSSLGGQLLDIGYCLWMGDLYEWFKSVLPGSAQKSVPEPTMEEEEFTPQPSAIPFGPFLAVGFLLAVFIGETITAWYLAVALPKP